MDLQDLLETITQILDMDNDNQDMVILIQVLDNHPDLELVLVVPQVDQEDKEVDLETEEDTVEWDASIRSVSLKTMDPIVDIMVMRIMQTQIIMDKNTMDMEIIMNKAMK